MSAQSDAAKNLRAIEDMAARLEERAIDRSNARDMPGGDALVNIAPIASPRQWAEQLDVAERQAGAAMEFLKDAQPDLSHEDPDEFWPASEILTWWSEDYRQRLHMDYEGWHPTLRSEVAFLRNRDVADWIWDNEPKYDDFAADISRAKSKLENILIEGDRSERTPVVCDRCDDGRQLVKVYGETAETDRWKCMGCRHLFDLEEVSDALGTQMRRTEPREWVTRTQAVDLLRSMGHQGRTAAKLVGLPEAQEWKDETSKIRYVSWPDVWRAHLLALQAAKIRLEDAARKAAHKKRCEDEHPEDCWIDGRGCQQVCPRGSECEWFACPVHQPERVSA